MPSPQDQDETPPGPPSPSTPPARPARYISSRLREKIAEAESLPEKPIGGGGPPWGGIIGAVIVIALVIGAFVWWRGSHAKPTAAVAPAADSTKTAAAADSTHATPDSSAMAAASPVPSPSPSPHPTATKPAATKPAAASAAKTEKPAHVASTDGAPAAPKTSSKGPFGIAVGTYMFEDKANETKDAMASSTGLPAIVMPADDGGTTVYKVVLGNFPTRSAAEKQAAALLTNASVHEAEVVPRPKP